MNPTSTKIEDALINASSKLRDEIQDDIEVTDFYCLNVHKAEWPKDTETKVDTEFFPVIAQASATEFGSKTITYRLKNRAINSPTICLEDIRTHWQLDDIVKRIQRVMKENLRWVWSRSFQKEVAKFCQNRSVVRETSRYGAIADALSEDSGSLVADSGNVWFPPRVNFFGKEVQPYTGKSGGRKWCVNPKYLRAAEQVIVFHPDIVHFLFPDLEHWIGTINWKNILSREDNPDGYIGFYRALLAYAARPVRPDLGYIITIVPPGIKGWLWYWAWKIVRYVP
jgi:hypothetical protein